MPHRISTSLLRLIIAALALLIAAGCSLKAAQNPTSQWEHVTMATETQETGMKKITALDARQFLPASLYEWNAADEQAWLSPLTPAPFAFDELIYSWSWDRPLRDGQGWRLYLRVGFDDGTQSPWLYAGFWGAVDQIEPRKNPEFEHGHIAMDQLLLKRSAAAWQFKVVEQGTGPRLTRDQLPALHIITTLYKPSPEVTLAHATPRYENVPAEVLLDLPLRLQEDAEGNYTPDRCQSAAVAAAMEYYGKPLPLDVIIPFTSDPEYNYPGIWPRTLGAAAEHGFHAYIERFRDWDQVRATVAENKVILCSIRMPRGGNYIAPPYPNIGGHIVALNGVTADGRVVVTDSALRRDNRGYRCQWLVEDFEKIWFEQKGGVGMVICPPNGHTPRRITDLPEFPKDRYRKEAATME